MAQNTTDWKHCVDCGNTCITLQNEYNNYFAYCCLCLPVKYITRPVRDWLCESCACEIHATGMCLHNEDAERFNEYMNMKRD